MISKTLLWLLDAAEQALRSSQLWIVGTSAALAGLVGWLIYSATALTSPFSGIVFTTYVCAGAVSSILGVLGEPRVAFGIGGIGLIFCSLVMLVITWAVDGLSIPEEANRSLIITLAGAASMLGASIRAVTRYSH